MSGAPPDPPTYDRRSSQDDVDHPETSQLLAIELERPLEQDVDVRLAAITAAAEDERVRRSKWRHTLGIILLLATVFMWTASSFLASTMFADDSYSKPYFVTYINASFFGIPLAPVLFRRAKKRPGEVAELVDGIKGLWGNGVHKLARLQRLEQLPFLTSDVDSDEDTAKPVPLEQNVANGTNQASFQMEDSVQSSTSLSLLETTKVGFEFCFLWFLANYFNAACLEYTTVSSSTILSSTSSIWTLLCGSLIGVEKFTIRKLIGVLVSLCGIVLISTMDVTGESEEDRGSFPYKSPKETAIGDAMAFFSALMYGFYAVLMKKRIGDEGQVNMPLFFGIVGIFNILLMWPGIIFVHATGIEPFQLPPSRRILLIIIVNSTSSLISDICWAYAVLLTSPLVVTIGLSLTIPLSLVGQMILDSQYSSVAYWFGAGAVVLSFLFINHEESKEINPEDNSSMQSREV